MQTVDTIINQLNMLAHPEGGYFAEHYRSSESFAPTGFDGQRSYATSIYFLLEKDQFSALHKIKSDEIWHFYLGEPLEIIEIEPNGKLIKTVLGQNFSYGQVLSYVVKAGNWFGSRPLAGSVFSLVGCTVSPGFDFEDFEMPSKTYFLDNFPQHKTLIEEICR
jgi:predicted cupin superfamily sugar epimerase